VRKAIKNFDDKFDIFNERCPVYCQESIITNYDFSLINHSFGNNHTEEQYNLYSKKLKNKLVFLTSNYKYFKLNHEEIFYFPYYFFDCLYNTSRQIYDIKNKRPYKLQCLNLNPWIARTVNYLEICKKPWINECQLSFLWTHKKPNSDTTPIGVNTLKELTDIEREEIMKQLDNKKIPLNLDNWETIYTSNSCYAHKDCYIDYVTENSINQEFITEKTWKPIFSGQLFLILGSRGLVNHLRDLGIDTFDDIIDHDSYDYEDDYRKKIKLILDQIDNLMNSNLDKIWDHTYYRRKKNLNLVLDPVFHDFLIERLVKKIS
jgi:hypothetical protein